MSRLTKVSIDSVLYDIGSKGINSYATLSEMVNEKVSELYDGCIAWCNEDKKYYQWLSENEIISQFGRWRELEFGSEFQVSDPTVDASTEKYKGKIIQYVGVDDVTSGFKRGCFYESRLSNVINYVVATVDASTVGTYYRLDDGGNYNPITLIGDGTGYDASTVYYKKQDVEVYAWAYINSLKVETEFDENSENAVANGIITKKFEEVIQDYTDKNEELKEYVDTDVTTALQQYADDLIADVEEVTEDKVWSNSKTKDYVDTALEDYTTSATEILQAEYDALDEETKLANNYHCTDTGRMYYKGILYGDKKPIELTYEEYKTLEEAGLVETDVDYIVKSNESGVLLTSTDVAYDNEKTVKGKFDEVDETIDEISKQPLYCVYDRGLTGTSNPSYFKLNNVLVTPAGQNYFVDLILLLVSRSGDKVYVNIGRSGGATPNEILININRDGNPSSKKIEKIYRNETDLYVSMGNYIDFFKIYLVAGTLNENFEVVHNYETLNTTNLVEIPIAENAIKSDIIGTKTQYRGSRSIDISTGGRFTLIYSSEYASQAGCYMLLSNFNTEPLLIELGRNGIGQFKVTATHKSQNVDTITVTTAGDEYSWYVLQF